ncbi:MAG: glutamate 5-kinase [Dehalococcoidia bacterium]
MSRGSDQRQPVEEGGLTHRRVVVKVGTNLLTAGGAGLDGAEMSRIAVQIAALRARGGEAILVSSGAIEAGRERLRASDRGSDLPHDLHRDQVLAAVGQSRLMSLWDERLEAEGIISAQALLTRADLADRLGYLNARNTLLALLDLRVVPIVNENDVVSVEEIEHSVIGDNDNLSALVANLVDADLLLLLTDTAGLHTADPATSAGAALIETVEVIDESIERAAAGAPGTRGKGGMRTKVEAARIATQYGAHVVIADGRADDIVLRAAAGEPAGTHFLPAGDRIESRRRYLLSGLPVRGTIVVDEGAAGALERDGTSLLPVGAVRVSGNFGRGDVVRIEATDGHHIANGISNYGVADAAQLCGVRSDGIAALLGHEYGEELVHRNNLVLV